MPSTSKTTLPPAAAENKGASVVIGMKPENTPAPFQFAGVTNWPRKIKAHRNDTITWKIRNKTESSMKVGISQFVRLARRVKLGPDPVEFNDPQHPNPASVDPNKTEKIIGTVKNGAPYGLYAYTVLINGQPAKDPELQIDKAV